MQGYLMMLGPAYFAPAYFGNRYFGLAIPANHTVSVGLALRSVNVPAVGAEPGMSEAGRVVTVPSVIRSVAVQAVTRIVVAEPREREA
jgi:hypothetical protein